MDIHSLFSPYYICRYLKFTWHQLAGKNCSCSTISNPPSVPWPISFPLRHVPGCWGIGHDDATPVGRRCQRLAPARAPWSSFHRDLAVMFGFPIWDGWTLYGTLWPWHIKPTNIWECALQKIGINPLNLLCHLIFKVGRGMADELVHFSSNSKAICPDLG